MRYRLRTLLILLAILPPLLWVGWGKYQAWRAEQERLSRRASYQSGLKPIGISLHDYLDRRKTAPATNTPLVALPEEPPLQPAESP